ncbi:MAG: AIR synthase-related protein, partial [Cyanobacteria bacterium J06638_6]
RETGMVPYEYLLSESQERMLFVVAADREAEVIEIFERWGLHAVVAGTVIQEPIVRILFDGETAAEIPALALSENTPIYHRELLPEPPAYAQTAWAWREESLPPCSASGIALPKSGETLWTDILHTLLAQPTIASKAWVYRQYDHQVQNNTVHCPGQGDAAVIRLRPQETVPGYQPGAIQRGLAATVDCNARHVYLNPYEGAKAAVAEAARNLSCVGALPLAVTDNLNFGSPEKPIGYWQLAEACRGLADACREFETPVTGGNVSLYNETVDGQGHPQPIYPTPVVGMVGLIDDLNYTCGQGWQQMGDRIYLLGVPVEQATTAMADGKPLVTLGGSEYLAAVHGQATGYPPVVDMALEKRVQTACRHGIAQGWVRSAHDCAEGGLAVALAESCISGRQGAMIQLPLATAQTSQRWDRLLFGEGGARIVVSINPDHRADWEAYLDHHLASFWQPLGTVQSDTLTLATQDDQTLFADTVSGMTQIWQQAIEQRLAGD